MVFPGKDGKEILSRADYLKSKPKKGHRASNMEAIPPPLLTAGPSVALRVGEVKTFLLVDEPVRAMSVKGGAARVFWSRPYQIDRMEDGHLVQHKGADVHFLGHEAGAIDLELELTEGGARTVHVEVRPGRPTVGS